MAPALATLLTLRVSLLPVSSVSSVQFGPSLSQGLLAAGHAKAVAASAKAASATSVTTPAAAAASADATARATAAATIAATEAQSRAIAAQSRAFNDGYALGQPTPTRLVILLLSVCLSVSSNPPPLDW